MLSERACSNRLSDSSDEFDIDQAELLDDGQLDHCKPDASKQGGYRDYSKDEKALNSKKMIYRTHDQSMFKDKKLSLPNSSTNLQANMLKKKKSLATNHNSQNHSHNHIPHKDDDADSETSLDFAQLIPMKTPKTLWLASDLAEVDSIHHVAGRCSSRLYDTREEVSDSKRREHLLSDVDEMVESNYLSGSPTADLQTDWLQYQLDAIASKDSPPAEDSPQQPAGSCEACRQSADQVLLQIPLSRDKAKPLNQQSPKKKLHPNPANISSSQSQRVLNKPLSKINHLDQSHESDDLPEGTPTHNHKNRTSDLHYIQPNANTGKTKKPSTNTSIKDRSLNMGTLNRTFEKKKPAALSNHSKQGSIRNTLQQVLERDKEKQSTIRMPRYADDSRQRLNSSLNDSYAIDSVASRDTPTSTFDKRLQFLATPHTQTTTTPPQSSNLNLQEVVDGSEKAVLFTMNFAAKAKSLVRQGLVKELGDKGIYPFVGIDVVESVCARLRLKAVFEDAAEHQRVQVSVVIKQGSQPESKELIYDISGKLFELFRNNAALI